MSRNFTQRAAAFTILVTSSFAATACDWRAFKEYEDSAPIRVYDAPKGYRLPGYGNVLTSFEAGGKGVIVASAGANSPVRFERMWTGKHLSDEAITRCKGPTDCKDADGVGETLIPFPVWAHGTPQKRTGCILSPATPKAFVFCDSNTAANQSWDLALDELRDPASTVHFSGVGLPEGHRLGIAILGAYALSNRGQTPSAGRLFYQPDFQPPGQPSDDDQVPTLERLPLRDPRTSEPFADEAEPGNLGFAIAAAPNAAGELLIAISQPSHERVIVASYDDALPGGIEDKLRTRACLENPEPGLGGFGKRLLVGDINDDGLPELFVGIDPTSGADTTIGVGRVWMYRGTALPTPEEALTDCPPFAGQPVQVDCESGVRGVDCADTGFGAALALGDVDGDGVRDLLVGAPYADVPGGKDAGAVWILPGSKDPALRGALDSQRISVLFATRQARANLGMAVAALRTKGRDEPVAGAPGENRLYTFMCSALEDDVSTKSLCLPK
jgi:hypothetical protein